MPVKSILFQALKIFAGIMAVITLVLFMGFLMTTYHPMVGIIFIAAIGSLAVAILNHV